MKRIVVCVVVVALANVGNALAQTTTAQEDKLKDLTTELAIANAQTEIAKLKYGDKAVTPMTGNVEGAANLSGMAQQHLPRATQTLGESMGTFLAGLDDQPNPICPKGVVIIEGQDYIGKLARASSSLLELEALKKELAITPPAAGAHLFSSGLALAAIGTAVSVAGLFKSDYSVTSSTLAIDQSWLVASMLTKSEKGCTTCSLLAERYPDPSQISSLLAEVNNVVVVAEKAVVDPKNEVQTERLARAKALKAGLLKPDESGVLPLVTTALYRDAAGGSRCMALLGVPSVSPIMLTKSTIWGKGGRAYLNLPVQVSVTVVSPNGRPVLQKCEQVTTSTSIKLKDLTKNEPNLSDNEPTDSKAAPWDFDQVNPGAVKECSVVAKTESRGGQDSGG